MTVATSLARGGVRAGRARGARLPLPLRFAWRELRGGLLGLRLLAACLFLGVSALAGVGSLSASLLEGIEAGGRRVLGGDIELVLTQKRASSAERQAMAARGTVSEVIDLRTMAGRPGSAERTLVEVKAVDSAYPLYGRFTLSDGRPLAAALGPDRVVAAQDLADRLGLGVGDRIELGRSSFSLGGIIGEEPDRAGSGLAWGPRLLMGRAALERSGLLQPGGLVRYHYRLQLPPGESAGAVSADLQRQFPMAGWEVRSHEDGAPGLRRFVERMGQFLTLVGLTSLIVAGVGVANGVGGYLERKSGAIATLKALGASSRQITLNYLVQVGLVSLGAIVAGLAIGATAPLVARRVLGEVLPVSPVAALYWKPLGSAALYGVLIALAFAMLPLARARAIPAARLLRSMVESGGRPSSRMLAVAAASLVAVATLAIATAREPLFAAGFVAAALGLLGVLALLALGVGWCARCLPHPRDPLLRLALAGLSRPKSPAGQLIVALGLGLTLFAALAAVQTSLNSEIQRTVPERAPTLVVIDIPHDGIDRFRALVGDVAPETRVDVQPSLRGPITAVRGVPVSSMANIPDEAWILRGDRGLTYSETLPAGNSLVEGEWWPADYSGPPLVSIADEPARALGLKPGDEITVSVLGVDVTAKIANLRRIDWDSLSFNFAVVFAPGTLEDVPHAYMAALTVPPAEEARLSQAIARAFPESVSVRVKDVLGSLATLIRQMGAAVRAAASVTVAAGIAVLIGSVAAQRQARLYDSVLLKVLGATRRQILWALVVEIGLLAAAVAGLAFLLGSVAGWYVVRHVLDLDWQPDWATVALTVLAGAVVTVVIGLTGSLAALNGRPASVLRTL